MRTHRLLQKQLLSSVLLLALAAASCKDHMETVINPDAVQVKKEFGFNPAVADLVVGESQLLSAENGTPPYVFEKVSGPGEMVEPAATDTEITYNAGSQKGTAVLKVKDASGREALALLTIHPSLTLSGATTSLGIDGSVTLTTSGGVPPMSFEVIPSEIGTLVSNPSDVTVDSSSAVFTGVQSGQALVIVTDSMEHSAQLNLTVRGDLAISPAAPNIATSGVITFTALGGVAPYSYALISGSGRIVGTTGIYTAPGSVGTASVQVTDAEGNTSVAAVHIVSGTSVSISPANLSTTVNVTTNFAATGGLAPYVYDLAFGVGSISSGGVYLAGATTGAAAVRVTDALGATSIASVTVGAMLTLSPTQVSIPNLVGSDATFTASGGAPPYRYTVLSGVGTINASSGYYTSATSGTAVVQVTDAARNKATSSVLVYNPLQISPASPTIAVDDSQTFTASGGIPPYSYELVSGAGSMNGAVYTAGDTVGTATVRVIDAEGTKSDATITINSALTLSAVGGGALAINNTVELSASDGVPPYSFSVVSDLTDIALGSLAACATPSASCTKFTAPATLSGHTSVSMAVQVQDSVGNIVKSQFVVNPALAFESPLFDLTISTRYQLKAVGGVPPYVFSAPGGGHVYGDIYYSDTDDIGPYALHVVDAHGNTADATVNVNNLALFAGLNEIDMVGGSAMRLRWTDPSVGGYFTVYQIIGGTEAVVATVPSPATNYLMTGLSRDTSYTYRVRLTDSGGNTDRNTRDLTAKTKKVVVTHQGWSNVQALGAYVPASQAIDLSASKARVQIKWNPMTTSEGEITSYQIYRAEVGGQEDFSNPVSGGSSISPSLRSYTDNDPNLQAGVSYYYVVQAVVNGEGIMPSGATHPLEIKVTVPPDNMALVHRWIANQEMCSMMGKASDPFNSYRCSYTGPGNVGGYYDIAPESSVGFFMDQFEVGCNYSNDSSCGGDCIKNSNPYNSLLSPKGTVLFDRSVSMCKVNLDGTKTGWTWADSYLGSSFLSAMASSSPGLPPLDVPQAIAHDICTSMIAEFGAVSYPKKLMTRKQQIAAAAWDPSLTDVQIATLESGVNLPVSHACNTQSGDGLAYDNSNIPSDLETLPCLLSNNASGCKSVRTGGSATSACVSRYGIRDLVGNMAEWTSDQLLSCNSTTHTCAGTTSLLDPANTDFSTFAFDGVIGPGGVASTASWTFASLSFNSTKFLLPLGLPVVGTASASLGATPNGTGDGALDFATKLQGDAILLNSDAAGDAGVARGALVGGNSSYSNQAGRFFIEFEPPEELYYGVGFRCVLSAP